MSIEQLKKFADMDNIASELDEDELREIGMKCLSHFDDDKASMADWLADVRKVMDLASLIGGPKNYPLPNSANIKFPLVTKACYEFTSRIYPELVKDNKVVRARVIGKDISLPTDPQSKTAIATRVASYMNYQLLEKNTYWEQDLDRLLNLLALIGFVCKKTYYDPIKRDVCSDLCEWQDLIIHSDVRCLEDARRVSHVLHLHLNDLISGSRAELFLEEPIDEIIERHDDSLAKNLVDVVEMHTYLDLDDDDYEEPYIVTFLKDSGKVLRIKARFETDEMEEGQYKSIEVKKNKIVCIRPIQHFTDFHFLVNPKGKFQSVGFGTLMSSLNNAINSLMNQLLDAGQLRNLQGGFIDSRFSPVATGNTLTRPGEFVKLKAVTPGMSLKDGVFPFNYNEPSQVLMTLMGTLVDSGKDLSASSDVMTGNTNPENSKTGATLAMMKEGEKVHTAIQKRVYRSMGSEFRKIFHLNSQYLDPRVYLEVVGDDSQGQELSISQSDFDESKIKVLPVADPNIGSDMQRAARAQILAGIQTLPGVDALKVTQRLVMSLDIEHPEELLADPKAQQAPNPEIIKLQAEVQQKEVEAQQKDRELDLEEKRLQLDMMKVQSEIILNRANAMKSVALADQAKATTQIDAYDMQLNAIESQLNHMVGLHDLQVGEEQRQTENDHKQQELDQNQQEIDNAPTDTGSVAGEPSDGTST